MAKNVKHYQQQWERLPGIAGTLPNGMPRYKLRDGYRRTNLCLPDEMRDALLAIKAQLQKDRKLLYIRGYDLPMKPSINSIALKAIELMLWGSSKDTKPDKQAKPTKQAKQANRVK